MCQLQYIKTLSKENTITPDGINLLTHMLLQGNIANRDATGAFIIRKNNKHGIIKSTSMEPVFDKLIIEKNAIEIIGHNRLATSGDEKQQINNHPFKIGQLVWVHNGVLSNYANTREEEGLEKTEIDTDSYIIGQIINKKLIEGKKIEEAIKYCAEKITGSFSVLLWYKGKTYYFKGKQNSMYFALVQLEKDYYIVGSTNKTNIESPNDTYHYGFPVKDKNFKKISQIEVEDNTIYELGNKGIRKIGTFTEKPFTYTYYNANGRYASGKWKGWEDIEKEITKEEEETTTPTKITNKEKKNGKLTRQEKKWFRKQRKWIKTQIERLAEIELTEEDAARMEEYYTVLEMRIKWIEQRQPNNKILDELKSESTQLLEILSIHWQTQIDNEEKILY